MNLSFFWLSLSLKLWGIHKRMTNKIVYWLLQLLLCILDCYFKSQWRYNYIPSICLDHWNRIWKQENEDMCVQCEIFQKCSADKFKLKKITLIYNLRAPLLVMQEEKKVYYSPGKFLLPLNPTKYSIIYDNKCCTSSVGTIYRKTRVMLKVLHSFSAH